MPVSVSLRKQPTSREIFGLVTQTSFCEGSSGDLAKRRLFSQAKSEFVCDESVGFHGNHQPSTQAFSPRSPKWRTGRLIH